MKVFIVGATGVLGRGTAGLSVSKGDSAIGLVRVEKGEEIVNSLGGDGRRANIFDRDGLADCLWLATGLTIQFR
jgi:NAD(P)-dependent dehydrogenase (short-subunit alcohol dehydrogenase family)